MPDYDNVVVPAEPDPAQRRSRWGFALVALVLAAGVGTWFYIANRPRPAKIVRQDIVGQIPMKGTILVPPDARADVYAPFASTVESVHSSVGKHVKRGDLLVKLQVTNAEAYHEQTKQAVKAAETAYTNAYNQLNASVISAQRQLDAARAAARSTVTPPPPADQTDRTDQTYQPPTNATEDVAIAESAVQQAIASREAQLTPYRQHLEAAREANRQARAGEKLGELRAPITGTVLALNAQPGQAAGTDAKNPLATVVDLSKIQVEGVADPEHSAYLKEKMDVILTFKELPGQEFNGEIANITTRQVERAAGLIKNQELVAVIDLNNREALVRPGMTPIIAAKTGEVKDVLAAPAEAVDTDKSGRPILHVLRGSNWQEVPVTTGLSDGRVVQIKSGVKEGETIQVTPDVLHAASPLRKP